ncbi:MAG: hypothetical protein GX766_04475 [Firmicutes bacterium]|jgi:hypothetical protein|nr:hypothetical protein [Bacillota bacterium]HQD39603.1 hypothetical protein [Bacillota bacterium]
MEVAESKGILFLTLAVTSEDKEIIATLAERDLIERARETVINFIDGSLVKDMVVGFDGEKIQVAVKL